MTHISDGPRVIENGEVMDTNISNEGTTPRCDRSESDGYGASVVAAVEADKTGQVLDTDVKLAHATERQIQKLNVMLNDILLAKKLKVEGNLVPVTARIGDAEKELLNELSRMFGMSQGNVIALILRFYAEPLAELQLAAATSNLKSGMKRISRLVRTNRHRTKSLATAGT